MISKQKHYKFIPCKTDELGMKLEWDNESDAPIDGAWNWWMDKTGNVEYARMKEDAYDHFFPSPEHLNLQNSTWEVQSLAGYFKEVYEEAEKCETEPSCFNCRWHNDYTKWCHLLNITIEGRANACAMWECCKDMEKVIELLNSEKQHLTIQISHHIDSIETGKAAIKDLQSPEFVERNKDRECWSEDWTIQDFIKLNINANNRAIEARSKILAEKKDYLSQIERALEILKEE